MNGLSAGNSGRIGEQSPRGSAVPVPLQKRAKWLFIRYWPAYLIAFAVSAAGVYASHRWMPSFHSRAVLTMQAAINNPLQSLSARLGGFSGFDVDGREADRYITRLRIRSYFVRLAEALRGMPEAANLSGAEFCSVKSLSQVYRERMGRLAKTRLADLPPDEVIRRLQEMIVFSKDGIDAVGIHVSAASRLASYLLTNVAADTAVRTLVDYEDQDLRDSDVYLKIQARRTQQSIEETESSIARFKKKKKLFSMSPTFDDANMRASELQRELADTELAIEQAKLEERTLRARAPAGGEPEPQDYKFSFSRKLSSLHREASELETKREGIRSLLNQLHQRYDENAEQEILDLRKNLDLQNSLDQELKKHDFQMQMRRISAQNKFRLLEPARLDQVQVGEGLLAKLLIAFLVSTALVTLIGYFHDTTFPLVRDRLILRDEQLSVIGGIPDGRTIKTRLTSRRRSTNLPKMSRLMNDRLLSCFHHLACKIVAARDEAGRNRGTILSVTSVQPHEGKSFCTQKVGEALARAGQRVLLIDADLRSPVLSRRIGTRAEKGLAEVIRDPKCFGSLRLAQVKPRLDLLPAGRSESGFSLVLAHTELKTLLTQLSGLYDFVLIDCPPVGVADDAGSIAPLADMPLLVAGFGEVSIRALRLGVEQLAGDGDMQIFAILNKVPLSEWSSYGGYRRSGPITGIINPPGIHS